MAQDTYNYPCYQTRGWGYPDGTHGMFWSTGPTGLSGNPPQPFDETFTCIMSFFHRTGWSHTGNSGHGLFSIGNKGRTGPGIQIRMLETAGDKKLIIKAHDTSVNTDRVLINLGDEDGVNWLSADKWYQIGFSVSNTASSWCVNGVTSPKQTVATNSPGALNLDYLAQERLFAHYANANAGVDMVDFVFQSSGYPTLVLGTSAFDSNYLDFSSATVRDRIWDSNGAFKNPGENGSLWFGDTYGDLVPDYHFLDGSPRRDNGSFGAIWGGVDGGGSGSSTPPGGLKKMYE